MMSKFGEDWRERLRLAIEASGRSQRQVSLAAGNAAGYANSLIKDGKDPSIENLIGICDQVGVSLSYVPYGFDVSPETEEVLRLLQEKPSARKGVLQILRGDDA